MSCTAKTGAPAHELSRSPAAARVGELAAASGLFLAHYEYRHAPHTPEDWLPLERPDLGERPEWANGVLAESKYQGFRNDLMLGSFHPGHRAKWTAHELCHGLVGFAWYPGASDFFNALAARLSELLPVALFYFFDEAHLRRCPLHLHGGALFATLCRDCERLARQGALNEDPEAERFREEGRRFVDRELAAVRRSIRLGRPVHAPWANLDLMSDGLAYATAQGPRLRSRAFDTYARAFFPAGSGLHASLEELEARTLEVMEGILQARPVQPWHGRRELWMAQDLGWRLLELACESDTELANGLGRLAMDLAAAPNQTGLTAAIAGYVALSEDYDMPEPEQFLGLGYDLPLGFGKDAVQIAEGIESALPTTVEWIRGQGDDFVEMARAFSEEDVWERTPLGRRFADWLVGRVPGELADLAHFEATVCHAPAADAATLSLAPQGESAQFRIAPDVTVFATTPWVLNQVGVSELEADVTPHLAIRREATGEPMLIALPGHLGPALLALGEAAHTPAELGLNEADLETLHRWQLIVPERYAL